MAMTTGKNPSVKKNTVKIAHPEKQGKTKNIHEVDANLHPLQPV